LSEIAVFIVSLHIPSKVINSYCQRYLQLFAGLSTVIYTLRDKNL